MVLFFKQSMNILNSISKAGLFQKTDNAIKKAVHIMKFRLIFNALTHKEITFIFGFYFVKDRYLPSGFQFLPQYIVLAA